MFVESSGYVIVTEPSSPTSTSLASGFFSLTLSSTDFFSSSVNFFLSLTSVFSGSTAGFFSASVSAGLVVFSVVVGFVNSPVSGSTS